MTTLFAGRIPDKATLAIGSTKCISSNLYQSHTLGLSK